ncbi:MULTISPECIES: hypothetical protein [unclassified Bradyrhizobium]|uniref:hypothetical protein n=1 Tax=unclassified Bradyrhizobium TaxID=2631580 RepID=UPI001FFAABAA|nr:MULTISPECIES: hypothetical protein [unclassified Bradyrhizobium]MCK1432214.1 hypothetical protein [Bradyrhizobium sp. 87]MCK1589236.1 hypothetical protein [Bradyrhizobium sp. 169]
MRASGSAKSVDSIGMQHLFRIATLPPEQRHRFPEPFTLWACDNIDAASETDCYRHIGLVTGKSVVQVAVERCLLLLLASAADGILITPGEALVAGNRQFPCAASSASARRFLLPINMPKCAMSAAALSHENRNRDAVVGAYPQSGRQIRGDRALEGARLYDRHSHFRQAGSQSFLHPIKKERALPFFALSKAQIASIPERSHAIPPSSCKRPASDSPCRRPSG